MVRRLLPAMAATLAVFLLAYAGMFVSDVRMHYATPVHVEEAAPVVRGAQLSINTPSGLSCMRDKGYRWFADYHPADRYWRFQLTEAGVLLAVSLAFGALAWRRS